MESHWDDDNDNDDDGMISKLKYDIKDAWMRWEKIVLSEKRC